MKNEDCLDKEFVLGKVKEFLAKIQETTATAGNMLDLYIIVGCLIAIKWKADADGDHPVEFKLIDRKEYRKDNFVPVKYTGFSDTTRQAILNLRDLMTNLSVAYHDVDVAVRELPMISAREASESIDGLLAEMEDH